MSATIHRLDGKRPPSLEPLIALVADDMNSVNAVILARMQSRIPLIPELAGHLIAGGGKRMRPMLTLAKRMPARLRRLSPPSIAGRLWSSFTPRHFCTTTL